MSNQFPDVIYSLPTLTHSAAITTRCLVDARCRRYQTKYMPDFGGVLNVPGFMIKNNALSKGLAFDKLPRLSCFPFPEDPQTPSKVTIASECLVVNSYLKTIQENEFVVIRALDNTLDFNLLQQTANQSSCNIDKVISYATIPYSGEIIGIKYSDKTPNFLVIKFDQEVKTIQLNDSYKVGEVNEGHSAVTLHASYTRNDKYLFKDASLNQYNSSLKATVSDDCRDECCFELYDISTEDKTPFQTIEWTSNESKPTTVESKGAYVNTKMVGGRSVRTLVPVGPKKGIQGLEKVPNNLNNYIVTTGCTTSLIDPRCNEISLILLEKSDLMSFYPSEYCRYSLFSEHNYHQFYSLSSVAIRAMDLRFPGTPMNQINHMLDSGDHDFMSIKLIKHPCDGRFETLCVSSIERLCFVTFDQTQEAKFINPKSTHQPYHEHSSHLKSETTSKWMVGLDVKTQVTTLNESLFSVFQLDNIGDFYTRQFSFNYNSNDTYKVPPRPRFDPFVRINSQPTTNSDSMVLVEDDERNSSPRVQRSQRRQAARYLDIFEEDEYQEENLPSQAASLRFDAMMKKMAKT